MEEDIFADFEEKENDTGLFGDEEEETSNSLDEVESSEDNVDPFADEEDSSKDEKDSDSGEDKKESKDSEDVEDPKIKKGLLDSSNDEKDLEDAFEGDSGEEVIEAIDVTASCRIVLSPENITTLIEKYKDKVGTPIKPDPTKLINEDGTLNVIYAAEMLESSKSNDVEYKSVSLFAEELKTKISVEIVRPSKGEFKHKTKEAIIRFNVSR